MMKAMKIMIIASVVMGMGLWAWAGEEADVGVRFRGVAPADDMDWDSGTGLELQARFWSSKTLGVALSLGLDSWDAPTEYVAGEDAFGYMESTIQGSATVVPVGVSILCRSPVDRNCSFLFEVGLRYGLVDSSLHADVFYEDETGPVHISEDIDIDDAVFAVAGIAFEGAISPEVKLEAGFGYQFDLIKPDEMYAGKNLGETSFQAAAFHLGLVFMF
jgi:hypothetical protein